MTDLWDGALIPARIWHGRRGDVAREFRYRTTFLALPVDRIDAGDLPLAIDQQQGAGGSLALPALSVCLGGERQ